MDDAQTPARQIPSLAIAAWAAASVTLLALASAYDLPISEKLANRTSPWAVWFQNFGELPGYLATAAGAAITLATNSTRTMGGQLDKTTLAANLCLMLAVTLSLSAALSKAPISTVMGLGVAVAIVGLVLGLAIYARNRPAVVQLRTQLQAWRPLGLSLVLLCLCGLFPLELTKVLWGRARPYMVLPAICIRAGSDCRYRDWSPSSHCLDFTGETDHEQFDCTFTGWWHPNGSRSGLNSFPSGHTFSGWLPVPIALHWRELPHTSASLVRPAPTAALYVLVIGWGVLVGSSRVFVGAHWFSDTIVSDAATLALAAFLWRRHPPIPANEPARESMEALVSAR